MESLSGKGGGGSQNEAVADYHIYAKISNDTCANFLFNTLLMELSEISLLLIIWHLIGDTTGEKYAN